MPVKLQTTPERSSLMKKIRSTETKAEIALRHALWHKGIRYRKNYKRLPGKPDIAITTKRIAIFIDGEFWHGYQWEKRKEKLQNNRDYWIPKIEENKHRDNITNSRLKEMGWEVIRFWEHEVEKDINQCIIIIEFRIREREYYLPPPKSKK
jgi:DNA mismatch endonuclease, patch repair protein